MCLGNLLLTNLMPQIPCDDRNLPVCVTLHETDHLVFGDDIYKKPQCYKMSSIMISSVTDAIIIVVISQLMLSNTTEKSAQN